MTDNWTVNAPNGLLWTEDYWSDQDGLPPTPGESAFIGTNSGVAIVFLTSNTFLSETVASIGTSPSDTLAISGNVNLTATSGTGSSSNAGTITISDVGGLTIGTGDFDNTGLVSLQSFDADLASGGNVEFTGTGRIQLLSISGSTNNVIQGAAPTDEITNFDNRISGTGTIESVVFVNDPDGVLEATPGDTLSIVGSAYGGSFMSLGEMLVDDSGIMVLGVAGRSSTIDSNGVIQLAAGIHITELEIAGNVTIDGVDDQIDMQGGIPSNDYFVSNGAASSLNLDGGNVSGAGTLGDANMTLTVESATVVDADNGAGGSGNTTLIVTTGANTITNDGLLEATNGGTMDIRSAVNNASTVAAYNDGTLYVRAAITGPGFVVVDSGSTLNVLPGGAVSGLMIDDPNDPNVSAVATIKSGGAIDTNTKINGGELILDAGATFEANAKLTITHTGELVLEQNSFGGIIRSFAGQDFMDLNKIRFIGQSGADPTTATWTQTNSTSGQLQVAGVNRVIDLQMMGTYTSANFGLQSDGQHGTTVTYVP